MSNHDQRSMYESERDVRAENNPPPEIVQKPRQQSVQKPKQQAESDQPKPKRGKTIAVVAAILLLAAAGIAAVLFLRGREPQENTTAVSIPPAEYLADYAPSSELGQVHASSCVSLYDTAYVLPCPVQDFLNNGWEIDTEKTKNADRKLKPERGTSVYLINDESGASVWCDVFNPDDTAHELENCCVFSLNAETDAVKLEMYGGISFGSDKDEIRAALEKLPTASWGDITEYKNEIVYKDFTDATGHYCNTIDFELDKQGTVKAVRIESNDWYWRDGELPKEPDASAYTAPQELGEDLESGIVEIGGDLYQLPCPLSVFLDNGWKPLDAGYEEVLNESIEMPYIDSDENTAYSMAHPVMLCRDNQERPLSVEVTNIANHPMLLKDCLVVGVRALVYNRTDSDNAVVLQGGITIGETTDRVTPTDETNYGYGMVYEWKTEHQRVLIRFDTDPNVVSEIIVCNDDWKLGYITPDLK